jgi:hypothetical protein
MTSTFTRRSSGNGPSTGQELFDQIAPGRPARRRNWPRVGAGVALAVVCGAVFVLLYASAGSRHPVLAVAQPVVIGETITAPDLTTARVSSDSALSPIPAGEVSQVIGRRAAVALVPGTLLTMADLASGPLLGPGEASVGLDLKPGQVPAGLLPGDSVAVIETTSSGQQTEGSPSGTPTVLVSQATVLSMAEPTAQSATDNTEITLAVPADVAADVVAASSAGDIALAGLGPVGGS